MTDISSMTDQQLNEALAEWMGWHKGYGEVGEWLNKDNEWTGYSFGSLLLNPLWKPTTDMNQAVECANFAGNWSLEKHIELEPKYSGYAYMPFSGVGRSDNDNPARALSEAVLMAARGGG